MKRQLTVALGILFIATPAFAGNWMPVSKIQAQSSQAYELESECKSRSSEQCLDLGSDVEMVKLGMVSLVNDWGPESEVESCSDESDCTAKLAAKSCPEPLQKFADALWTKVYCVELLGKQIVKDSAAYTAHLSAQAASAALESALKQAKALQECGKRVMALMLVRNQPKGLSTAQVKSIVSTYAPVEALLDSGSLVSAKEEIQAVSADGVLVTEADKTALTQEIDKCLGL